MINDAFESDKAILKAEAVEQLIYIKEAMKIWESPNVLVMTHSPVHPSRHESNVLSEKRIQAVLNFFKEQGLPTELLITKAAGHDIVVNTLDKQERMLLSNAIEFRLLSK